MSANVNVRFEYETCFRKIRSSVVDRVSKNNRLSVCYDLREQVGNDPQILSKVVTGDETWCYGYYPETKQASSQWKTPNSPNPKKASQYRSNVKIMLISFFMLMELCTSNLFLQDKLWINNFIWRCWKDYAIVYGKNDQKCGVAVIGSFTTTTPLPTRPWVCSSFWQKKQHDGYSSSSLFTRPCAIRLLPVPSYERPDEREAFCWCQRSEKKTLEVLNNINTEEFQKCFQQ